MTYSSFTGESAGRWGGLCAEISSQRRMIRSLTATSGARGSTGRSGDAWRRVAGRARRRLGPDGRQLLRRCRVLRVEALGGPCTGRWPVAPSSAGPACVGSFWRSFCFGLVLVGSRGCFAGTIPGTRFNSDHVLRLHRMPGGSRWPLYSYETTKARYMGKLAHATEHRVKFDAVRTEATPERPRGLSRLSALHAPDRAKLVGFDKCGPGEGGARPRRAERTERDHGLGCRRYPLEPARR